MSQVSTLTIDVKLGERLAISGMSAVELLHKSGHLVRLRITAPREVKIVRHPAPEKRPDDVASMTE